MLQTIAQNTRTAHDRWNERIRPIPPSGAVFPDAAHAVIYREARSAMTSGKARCGRWKLRFERRTPPYLEPLMGWTAGDDTLTQVELTFPSLDRAVAYARRQRLDFTVQGQPASTGPRLVSRSDAATRADTARLRRLEWVERTLGPEVKRNGPGNGPDPARSYASPQAVLDDAALAKDEKRDLLRRWALDAYSVERALPPGHGSAPSRLDEVIDALIDLDGIPPSVIAQRGRAEQARVA